MSDVTPGGGVQDRDSRYCNARKRQGEGTCTRPAGWGTDHVGVGPCKLHGGSTAAHRTAAVATQARRDVVLFGGRLDVHPSEALLELVQWTAGEVEYWRYRVKALDEQELTWGVTKVKEGGDDRGKTEEAKPNIAYVMLVDSSNRLERYCSSALKAGVDERLVRVAEHQGELLASVIRNVLGDLDLSPVQMERVPDVVGRHLRAVAELEAGGAG